MSFKLRNIGEHPVSTLWGVLFMMALFAFVLAGRCTLPDIQPLALLVVPFLLYGRSGPPPGAVPAPAPYYDSTPGPELRSMGNPGATG